MLDANIQTQLKAYLERLQQPIELVASLDDSAKASRRCGMLLEEIISPSVLARSVSVTTARMSRRPSFRRRSSRERPAADSFCRHPHGS
jgi:alkyl hydroperoxide reductase subunit F